MTETARKAGNAFPLRLPPELMKWVRDHAVRSDRSVNSQITRLVRKAKQQEVSKNE